MSEDTETPAEKTYADGNYAIVEVMGHICHIGRYQEVEKFGQKFCEIEPILDDAFQPPVLVGGASIYQFRACTAQHAFASAPKTYSYRQTYLPAPSRPDFDLDDEIAF